MKLRAILKLLTSKSYVIVLDQDAYLKDEHKLIDQISRVLDEVRV